MRDRIFSSVLLPAPLLPISASASPRLTSNDTSRSAQNCSRSHARERMPHPPDDRLASVVGAV